MPWQHYQGQIDRQKTLLVEGCRQPRNTGTPVKKSPTSETRAGTPKSSKSKGEKNTQDEDANAAMPEQQQESDSESDSGGVKMQGIQSIF